jgi:hypothetical protein
MEYADPNKAAAERQRQAKLRADKLKKQQEEARKKQHSKAHDQLDRTGVKPKDSQVPRFSLTNWYSPEQVAGRERRDAAWAQTGGLSSRKQSNAAPIPANQVEPAKKTNIFQSSAIDAATAGAIVGGKSAPIAQRLPNGKTDLTALREKVIKGKSERQKQQEQVQQNNESQLPAPIIARSGIAGQDAFLQVQQRRSEQLEVEPQKPKTWGAVPDFQSKDRRLGVLSEDGTYVKNPTAKNLTDIITPAGNIGGKGRTGKHMYVVDESGNIIIGTRGTEKIRDANGNIVKKQQHMPHPTLIGGKDPRVQGAGIVFIERGKIRRVDNESGHFRPGEGSLEAARDTFEQLPDKTFHQEFEGYAPYDKGHEPLPRLDKTAPEVSRSTPAEAETPSNRARTSNSTRNGALAAGGISTLRNLADGNFSSEDARDVALNTVVGAASGKADDLLHPRLGGGFKGGLKAGGIVDAVTSAGFSTFDNAEAYRRGDITAGQATANVVVDTGVGVGAGMAGMAAGAAIGSVVPVAGTAVGALVGFGAGMLGSWAASSLAEHSGFTKWAKEGLGGALNNFNKPLSKAWDGISDTTSAISEGASKAWDAITPW